MRVDGVATALAAARSGGRLDREQALALAGDLTPSDLHALGAAAHEARVRRHGRRATWIRNLHINPSNVCRNACRFCGFAVREGDARARRFDETAILAAVAEAAPREVHITGGLDPQWTLARATALVAALRRQHPRLFIKAWTAVEIDAFAQAAGVTAAAALADLRAAGLDALPGGGAEVFSPRLRAHAFPDKIDAERWIEIHAAAHRLGLTSNATLLFGWGEDAGERVDHLLRLRAAQDASGGFTAFVPLAFQDGSGARPPPRAALAVTALARLVLDNVPHVKAYWPGLGLETAAAALTWGADDLDGTLGHERILHAAGSVAPVAAAPATLIATIRVAGCDPSERDGRHLVVAEAP